MDPKIQKELKRIAESTGLSLKQVQTAYARHKAKLEEAGEEKDDLDPDKIDVQDPKMGDLPDVGLKEPEMAPEPEPMIEPEGAEPADIESVCMEVPLLMKVFEFVREDIKNDIELHRLVTNLICLAEQYPQMTMDNYLEVIKDVQGDELTYLKKLAGIQSSKK